MMNQLRHILDGVSLVTLGATLAHYLPPIAAGLSIVWLLIQIGTWVYTKGWRRNVG